MSVVQLDNYRPTRPVPHVRRVGVDADPGKRTAPARRTRWQVFLAGPFMADLRRHAFEIGFCAGILAAYALADLVIAIRGGHR